MPCGEGMLKALAPRNYEVIFEQGLSPTGHRKRILLTLITYCRTFLVPLFEWPLLRTMEGIFKAGRL